MTFAKVLEKVSHHKLAETSPYEFFASLERGDARPGTLSILRLWRRGLRKIRIDRLDMSSRAAWDADFRWTIEGTIIPTPRP